MAGVASSSRRGAIVAAYLTGKNFFDRQSGASRTPQLVQTHADRAQSALWVTIGFAVVAVAACWFHTQTGAVQDAPQRGARGARPSAVLVLVVLTGDAGARAVWS